MKRLFIPIFFCAILLSGFYILWTNKKTGQTVSPQPQTGQVIEPKKVVAADDPVVLAAGDIACSEYKNGLRNASNCQQMETSDILVNLNPDVVLPLGDLQYDAGTLTEFQKVYDPSWGRVKDKSRPAVGNHEYADPNASGYYTYFGALAGDPNKGYYSYDLGAWHLIALNSNCFFVGGCGKGSPQELWLRSDLAASKSKCTLAYFHHPRFSSGVYQDYPELSQFWEDLYEAGTEVILVGHEHFYERFAPQNPAEQLDNQRGIRQFIVGTGGRSHYAFTKTRPNSEARSSTTFGVLKLILHPNSYSWEFIPVANGLFKDKGNTACH